MSKNQNLHRAKGIKNDEFYTRLEDIEKELSNYKQHFADKIVYCNCDDETKSQFWVYFHTHFTELGLKKLIATHFDRHNFVNKAEYSGGNDADVTVCVRTPLNSHGDFRSPQCVAIMKEADIVVSNAPFSLFQTWIHKMFQYNKLFLGIGPKNAITYSNVFPKIQNNQMWLGCNDVTAFVDPKGQIHKFGNIGWFTNLEHAKRHEPLVLTKFYVAENYHTYANYDAINVDSVADIPTDYDGKVGVPLSFLDKYNPDQFRIVKFRKGDDDKDLYYKDKTGVVQPYFRILIQRKSSDCS